MTLAEARFFSKQHEWQFDTAWQEMLNHATCKVVEAEGQRATASRHHQITTAKFHQDEAKVIITIIHKLVGVKVGIREIISLNKYFLSFVILHF